MLVATGKANYLATNGLAASFAICARGLTERRIPVLSLWHRSPGSTYPFQNGMQIQKRRMIEKECVPESIESLRSAVKTRMQRNGLPRKKKKFTD